MRIFHNETADRLAKRLIPGIAVAGLAVWGIAYGGPELENVPGLIPLAEAVELENGESASSSSAAGTLAALNTAGQGEPPPIHSRTAHIKTAPIPERHGALAAISP